MFLVDVTLYTGQHLQCEPEYAEASACSTAKEFCRRTMVESAIVVNMKTGEILLDEKNAASGTRIE